MFQSSIVARDRRVHWFRHASGQHRLPGNKFMKHSVAIARFYSTDAAMHRSRSARRGCSIGTCRPLFLPQVRSIEPNF
jgi:hypothetical protein